MKLSAIQKVQAACSAVKHRNELKQLLIRRYWQSHKTLKVEVGGVTALFDSSDFLSNILFWQGEFSEGYEPSVCEVLARLIENSKVYADVGGNVGFFSVLPALLNPSCKIFYFEMDSTIKPLLIRNMKLNKLNESRITIINAAVGDHDGELEYLPHPYSFLAKEGNESIDVYDLKYRARVISLDKYFYDQGTDPDLLKIDIDGAEMSALRGMSRIFKETKPDLLLEVHPTILPQFGSSAPEVCDFLRKLDYQFFLFSDFRNIKAARLTQIFDFDSLTSRTGDMILVTNRKHHWINTGGFDSASSG
jgi:FkbM family methyltransferase